MAKGLFLQNYMAINKGSCKTVLIPFGRILCFFNPYCFLIETLVICSLLIGFE